MGTAQRIVLVSNRLPPTEDLSGDSDLATRQVSGLVSAIRPVLGQRESLWFGWSGGTTAAGDGGDVSVSDFGPRRMVALDLPRREASLYYNVFSNRTLWPLLHNYPDRIAVRGESYSAYRRVNRRFAESLSPHLRPHDTLWVHDFHLFPLAAALRELGWPGKIGFFLHVPFPSVDTFSILPWARELLEDLLVYDLVGLQTRSHARNLMHTLIEEFRGAQIGDAFIYGSKRCRVGVYPVGTDPDTFRRLGAAPRQTKAVAGLRRLFPDQKLVLGVDGLDYTSTTPKGCRSASPPSSACCNGARRSEAKSAWSRSPCPRGSASRNTRARSGAPTRSSDGSTDGSPGTSGSRSTSSTGRSASGSWPGSTTRLTSASSRPSGTA